MTEFKTEANKNGKYNIDVEVKKGINRGDIYYLQLGSFTSSYAPKGNRPCVVIQQTELINKISTVLVVPLTNNLGTAKYSTHQKVSFRDIKNNRVATSVALCESPVEVDKILLQKKIGHMNDYYMDKIGSRLYSVIWGNPKKTNTTNTEKAEE